MANIALYFMMLILVSTSYFITVVTINIITFIIVTAIAIIRDTSKRIVSTHVARTVYSCTSTAHEQPQSHSCEE